MPTPFDDLVHDLNDAQREAVLHAEGPLLVVAGPGSGKTRVVSRRLAALLRRGVLPHQVLAVTFTNRAAAELRERVERLVPAGGLWVATFHGACARILREHGEAVGVPRSFTIYDEEDRGRLVGRVLRELPGARDVLTRGEAGKRIRSWKGAGVTPAAARGAVWAPAERMAAEVYARYEALLRAQAATDFDDLLSLAARLLADHPAVLESYRRRLRHVLVDEYQDTNPIQFRIARALSSGTGNLHATGDPDQSIYAWRGADIRNILDFREHYPAARILRLERNYRSVRNVLDAAGALIRRNRDRHEKDLLTEAEAGPPVRVAIHDDVDREGRAVGAEIAAFLAEGRSPREAAVLYRVNARSRAVEVALRGRGVPYQVVRGVEFFQRAEVKDLVAWLRLLANAGDGEAAARVLQAPARGVGDASVARILEAAAGAGLPVREILLRGAGPLGLKGRAGAALERTAADLRRLLEFPATSTAGALDEVLAATDYRAWVERHWPEDAPERLENVDELLAAARAWDSGDEAGGGGAGGVQGFLEQVALVSDQDRFDEDEARVTLMSLHAAKGLEFAAVWIVGVEEGVLPHARSLDDPASLEEERRLLFVGMTRARERLALSCGFRPSGWTGGGGGGPSRFLDEMGRGVEREDLRTGGGFGHPGPGMDDDPSRWGRPPGFPPAARGAPFGSRAGADPGADDPFVPDVVDVPAAAGPGDAVGFRAGDRVRHAKFGDGKVRLVERRGSSVRITVEFRMGTKTLDLAFARLEPLGTRRG